MQDISQISFSMLAEIALHRERVCRQLWKNLAVQATGIVDRLIAGHGCVSGVECAHVEAEREAAPPTT